MGGRPEGFRDVAELDSGSQSVMASWCFDESPASSRFGVAKTAKFAVISGETAAAPAMERAVEKASAPATTKKSTRAAETSAAPTKDEGGSAPSSKRRDHMVRIEREVQAAWAATGAFEVEADDERPKFFVTFPRGTGVE